MPGAEQQQSKYYSETASAYDSLHIHPGDEHEIALGLMSLFIDDLSITSILDVGSGTGRAMLHFRNRHPNLDVSGLEPVPAMIDQAISHGIPQDSIFEGDVLHLPFKDNYFDAVCACALLHHVREPDRAVREMCRVARRAVFISDANRFGLGSLPSRWLKLALYKTRLWPMANLIKTKGRGYTISETDGLAYSYSVYDNLQQLQEWSDRFFLIPTSGPTLTSWLHPLLSTHHILMCAFRS